MAWTLDRALIVTALIAAALAPIKAPARELVPFHPTFQQQNAPTAVLDCSPQRQPGCFSVQFQRS